MIHILKLSNGDTIVGDLIAETSYCITLNNPLELQLVNNPLSGSGLMSMYWLPIETETFHVDIRQQHVIVLSEAPNEISQFYKNSVANFLSRQKLTPRHQTLEDMVGLTGPSRRQDITKDLEEMRNRMLFNTLQEANTSIMH